MFCSDIAACICTHFPVKKTLKLKKKKKKLLHFSINKSKLDLKKFTRLKELKSNKNIFCYVQVLVAYININVYFFLNH